MKQLPSVCEGGRASLHCNVFDRWRSSFYVMAIMEWVHITWNGCETVNRSWLGVHKIEWA